jgi:hypothetical protein
LTYSDNLLYYKVIFIYGGNQIKEYKNMSDEEIEDECRNICSDSQTEEETVDRIKERFMHTPAVHFGKPNQAGQRMQTGLINGPRGNTISF